MLFLSLLIFSCTIANSLPENLSPLVLIPGFTATKLTYTASSEFKGCPVETNPVHWWVDKSQLVLHNTCVKDRVSVKYNFETKLPYNLPEANLIAPDTHVETLGTPWEACGVLGGWVYMKTPHDLLSTVGYTPCVTNDQSDMCNLAVVPWLWPYAPMSYYQSYNGDENQALFKSIINTVEHLYNLNNNRKVIIAAHSEGGLSLAHFMSETDEDWKNKFIEKAIFIAPAFASFQTTVGPVPGLIGQYNIPSWVDQNFVTDVTETWPGNLILLPQPGMYANDTKLVYVKHWETDKWYTLEELPEYYKVYNNVEASEAINNIWLYNMERLGIHPGVKSHIIAGTGIRTAFQYKVSGGWIETSTLDGASIYSYVNGDGTLPLHAVEYYTNVWLKESASNTHFETFDGIRHSDFIGTERGLLKWINFLRKDGEFGIVGDKLCSPGFYCVDGMEKECDVGETSVAGSTECVKK